MDWVVILMLLSPAAALSTLSPPNRLLVDLLPSPALGVGSVTPSFSFSPLTPFRNSSIATRRVVVYRDSGDVMVWDSGQVPAVAAEYSIRCGAPLPVGVLLQWTAQWTDTNGQSSAVSEAAELVVGLLDPGDWLGASWLGDGHTEFRATVNSSINQTALLFVASPGGVVVQVNGAVPVGMDSVGVSGWFDWTKSIPSTVLQLPLRPGPNLIELTIGCGAWCPSAVPTMEHSGRTIHTAAGAMPVVKMVLAVPGAAPVLAGGPAFSSRRGRVVNSSSWLGSTTDWSVDSSWEEPARSVPAATVAVDIPVASRPQPQMAHFNQIPAGSVEHQSNVHVYRFAEMIVGTATVTAGSWAGVGTVQLEYCEVLLNNSSCVRQSGYEKTGTFDKHIVNGTRGTAHNLPTRHSWRGFQYVLVTVTGGASFRGQLTDLSASWVGLQIERAASLSFEGPGADRLAELTRLVGRSFRSNLLTGLPTDCPTREKHGWLGDSMDIAQGAMFAFWTPTIFRTFVDQVIDAQVVASTDNRSIGFVPVVVPCHKGVDSVANDLSWTSGLVDITRALSLHYGQTDFVLQRWENLRLWTDGQLSNATHRPYGLPDFAVYGDEAAAARNSPSHILVGQQCASANFLIALRSMVVLAKLIGKVDDAARWSVSLSQLQKAFDELYWSEDLGFSAAGNVSQTLNSIALAASVGTQAHRYKAANSLLADVLSRNYSLTVGSVGQKWLLNILSNTSDAGHEASLRLALGDAFPGWGYWLSIGATTCWESWTSMDQPGMDHYHGSRNHAWLCGGLSEWLHLSLGGLRPAAEGYSQVIIEPKVATAIGPTAVQMSLLTVRGRITSNWTRDDESSATQQLTMRIELPPGVTGLLKLPLLSHQLSNIRVVEGDNHRQQVWAGRAPHVHRSLDGLRVLGVEQGTDQAARLNIQLSSGLFEFGVVTHSNTQT